MLTVLTGVDWDVNKRLGVTSPISSKWVFYGETDPLGGKIGGGGGVVGIKFTAHPSLEALISRYREINTMQPFAMGSHLNGGPQIRREHGRLVPCSP